MVRKGFRDNSVMSFISQESVDRVERETVDFSADIYKDRIPLGYKPNPEFIETKSKRVQVLLQPSIYRALKNKSQNEKISVNEAINIALRKYVGFNPETENTLSSKRSVGGGSMLQ